MSTKRVQEIETICSCGGEVRHTNVFITDKHELLIIGVCPNCMEAVKNTRPLKELRRLCNILAQNKPEETPPTPKLEDKPVPGAEKEEDKSFLQRLGIAETDGQDEAGTG
ncbi:MAG: hypothetical protein V4473_02330 [Patescibacteria group bacterium]